MEPNNEQFTQIPHSLMSNKDLTDQDKLTLGLILSFTKNNKDCFMGNEYIADKMGISKNAASIRIKRLEKLGCISITYTYKEGKKEVDKRYITLLSLTPKVSSHRRDVSSDRRGGIVPQTIGYRPVDEGVSSKLGGIRQPLLDNLLNNELNKVQYNQINNKILIETINEKFVGELKEMLKMLVEDGFLTSKQRSKLIENKSQIVDKIPALEQYINF